MRDMRRSRAKTKLDVLKSYLMREAIDVNRSREKKRRERHIYED